MSNSDDGFPNDGNGASSPKGTDTTEGKTDAGLGVPRPSNSENLADDIDLGDVDFDSIFGTSGKEKGPPQPKPRAPRLPPPLTKTPDRPANTGAKSDPPPSPGGRKTLMGLALGRFDDDEAGASSSGVERDDFKSERTEIAMGGAKSPNVPSPVASEQSLPKPPPPRPSEPHIPVPIAEAGDNPFGDLDDLGDFDDEKTNITESPLHFPEDKRDDLGESASSVPTDDLDEDDKTEVGMSLEEMLAQHDPGATDATAQPHQTSQSARDEFAADAGLDSFDEPVQPTPTSPGPVPDNFGFSNFDPDTHSASSSLIPNPIPEGGRLPGEGGGGEFESEKTELLDSPFTNEPLTARIHVLDGPCAGQEFFVNNLRNTLGRATNNTIVVADVAMSRQHLEVVNNGDGTFVLRDLQSVNGTALNGTRVREGDLFHGDRFEAGKSVFQFVLSGTNIPPVANRRVVPAAIQTGPSPMRTGPPQAMQAPMQARKSASSSSLMTKIAIAAGIVSTLIVLGLAFLSVQKKRAQQPESDVVAEGTTASSLYLQGVESVKARNWDEAERNFQKARMMDAEIAGIDAQIERIDKERGYERLLASAQSFLKERKRALAVEKIADIPRESVYYEDGQSLLRENKKLTVDELYTQAVAAFGRDDFDLAKEKIAAIREIVPEHGGASELEARLADAAEKEPEVAVNDKPSPRPRPRPRPKENDDWGFGIEGSGGSGSGKSVQIVNFTRGYSLYRSKKFGEAKSFFDDKAKNSDGTWARKAADARDAIGKFEKAYQAGNSAYASKKWSSAERQFLAARRYDKSVATNGYFNDELAKKIAGAKAELGSKKLAAGEFDDAYKYAKDAKNYDASSKELRELNAALSRKAKSLYVQAVNSRKTDPNQAAKLCRTIMAMTPSGDDSHKKAKTLLKEL